MARGGYGKRARHSSSSSSAAPDKGCLSVRKSNGEKKASTKNQIRSIQRLLRKPLPVEVKEAQQQRLEELRKQLELHQRSELEKKMALRYRRVKFFERRKIERSIRRLEKMQRVAADSSDEHSARQIADIAEQLADLKEDLEYVRFFPKTEKYMSLFMGDDDEAVVAKRQKLREQIKANLVAAAAAGIELEETGSEDDGATEMSEDDFFLAGSEDNADADDEWTDKASRPRADRGDTSKTLVPSTSGYQKDTQQIRKPSNLGFPSHNHRHKPQQHVFNNDRFKKQKISSKDLMSTHGHPSSSKNGRFKERPSSTNLRIPQGPTSSNRGGIDRRTAAPSHPSSSNSSGVNRSAISTLGSSTSETQQKKPRKRRPKKKK